MLELLWLLLPVAAASGWWLGHRGRRPATSEVDTPDRPPNAYFQGLNYLLNEQQDEAIDVFIRLVEVDSDTIETHLALGNLFRRRGEVDRAIRLHQNLIARPNLSRSHRSFGLLELARDYMRAGVLDRAEGLFLDLQKNRTHVVEASRQLLRIYEREQEWRSAIDTARTLQRRTGESLAAVIAHYWCELADAARRAGNPRAAGQFAGRALSVDQQSVRASILEGDLARSAGRWRAALRAYRRVESQDSAYLPEVIDRLLEAMLHSSNKNVLDHYLRQLQGRYNGFSVIQAATYLIRDRDGEEIARRFLQEQLMLRPSLRGLREWVSWELESVSERSRAGTEVILDMLDRLLESKPLYSCHHCGYGGRVLHWQCPSCREWNTVKPVIGIEGQ